MAFALLIHEDRSRRRQRSPAEAQNEYQAMLRYGASLADRGLLRAAEALKPDAEATTLRLRDGQPQLLDGPFAETKEMLGGFFLLAVDRRADAIALAAECPAAAWASIEIREVGTCIDA